MAWTEPSARWDADGVTVQATAEGDEYVINGTKLFIHDANVADSFLVVTRTKNGANPEDGITLFLLDAKSPGTGCNVLKAIEGGKLSEVTFNGVRVPKKNMIGELHKGWAPLTKIMKIGAVLLCAKMNGMGQYILEQTIDYAKTRIQFDMPIGVHQWVQGHCIELSAAVEGIKWTTYKAAWALTEGTPDSEYWVAIAKAWSSDAMEVACLRAHSVWSGAGYMNEWGFLPLYTRRAKTDQLYLGDSAYWRKKVAKHMDNWTVLRPREKPLGYWSEEQGPMWPEDAPELTASSYDFRRGG